MALGHWAVEYLGEGNGQGGSGGFAPDITNPQDGDTLVYNATAGKWVNGEGGSGGGGGLVVHLTKNDGVFYADHTAGEIIDAADTGAVISIITVMDGVMSIALLTRIENYLDDVEAPGVSFTFSAGSRTTELTAVSADSYPSYEDGQS